MLDAIKVMAEPAAWVASYMNPGLRKFIEDWRRVVPRLSRHGTGR